MFNFSYTEPGEVQGVIWSDTRFPRLGPFKDAEGKHWDIRALIDRYVCAVPQSDLHPYYTDTSGTWGWGVVMQRWEPYRLFAPASILKDFDEWWVQTVYKVTGELKEKENGNS